MAVGFDSFGWSIMEVVLWLGVAVEASYLFSVFYGTQYAQSFISIINPSVVFFSRFVQY